MYSRTWLWVKYKINKRIKERNKGRKRKKVISQNQNNSAKNIRWQNVIRLRGKLFNYMGKKRKENTVSGSSYRPNYKRNLHLYAPPNYLSSPRPKHIPDLSLAAKINQANWVTLGVEMSFPSRGNFPPFFFLFLYPLIRKWVSMPDRDFQESAVIGCRRSP